MFDNSKVFGYASSYLFPHKEAVYLIASKVENKSFKTT